MFYRADVQQRASELAVSSFNKMAYAKENRPDPSTVKPAERGKFTAAAPGGGGVEYGVNAFPPMVANPAITSPPKTQGMAKMTAAATGVTAMPAYFNWADSDNVAAVKGWPRRSDALGKFTSNVLNQLGCGSCWAQSSATMLGDRFAIFTQGPNPQLSPTDALRCVACTGTIPTGGAPAQCTVEGEKVNFTTTNGCAGGLPSAAAQLYNEVGTVDQKCQPYTWCQNDSTCKANNGSMDALTGLNKLMSSCSAVQCVESYGGGSPQIYKTKTYYPDATAPMMAVSPFVKQAAEEVARRELQKKNPGRQDFTARELSTVSGKTYASSISVTGEQDIKTEILANGPVVVVYAVYQDFFDGSSGGNAWNSTKGVYCNVQSGPKPSGDYYKNATAMNGFHAVVVVGWGVEKGVPDWTTPGQTMDVPYWIVRNSWSDKWLPTTRVGDGNSAGFLMPGHAKIAISNAAKSLNTLLYLDEPMRDSAGNPIAGGATAFEPLTKKVSPTAAGGGGGGGSTGGSAPPPPPPQPQPQPQPQPKVKRFGKRRCAVRASRPDVQALATAESVRFSCEPWSNTCTATTDGSGYATVDECVTECDKNHNLALGLTIGFGSLAVLAAILAPTLVSLHKKGKI